MIPILYSKDTTDFSGNGIGFLSDIIECKVTEERNGEYELLMQYPISGQHYEDITTGSIIRAKANETSDLQLFRIYGDSKPIAGIVTFSAEHISYDANGIPTLGLSITGSTAQMAITQAISEAGLESPFVAWSDIATTNGTNIITPCSLRSILGGQTGSVLDVWGGEYEFDNYTIKLHQHRGTETGVVIAYGKNLTDAKQEKNISECYTHIMPYAVKTTQSTDDSGNTVDTEEVISLPEMVLPLTDTEDIGHNRAYIANLTDLFAEGEDITADTLRTKATSYAATSNLGVPKVSITASFVQLWQTEEYKTIAPLERVSLCDTVTVRFTKLGIDATAKVIKTVYDSVRERYVSIELGDAKSNFANTILKQESAVSNIEKTVSKGLSNVTKQIADAITNATNLITGQNGGYVVLNPPNNPQEILILDTPSIAEAVDVWRFNSGGLGHSTTGYNGDYGTAITMDGQIVADFITTGILNGSLIAADSITTFAISQAYTDGVLDQSFTAAEGLIQAAISQISQYLTNDDGSGELDVLRQHITDLTASVNGLTARFTDSYMGGVNFVRNSSGLNGVSNDWTATGIVDAQQSEDTKNATVSDSCFRLSGGATLTQLIDSMVVGHTYNLSAKVYKSSTTRAYCKLTYNGTAEAYLFDASSTTFGWTDFNIAIPELQDGVVQLEIYTTGDYLSIADIMLSEGSEAQGWTPAPDEIYTEQTKIDRNGVSVENPDSDNRTVMNHEGFAVYNREEKVLTVAERKTTLTETEIKENLTVGKLKFIPQDAPSEGIDYIVDIVVLD
ncbi:MAG: phage tail protein [Oscillospiraceae bacterium]|nr:phage tail protein [Oscillospiraceae bacterium]